MQVVVGYSVPKTYYLKSPTTAHSVKQIVRGSYHKVMSGFATSAFHQRLLAGALSRTVKRQIRDLFRDQSALVFGQKEHVKEFTWNELWDELSRKVPLLVFFLKKLVKDVDPSKPVICLIISMLLTKQNRKMCLLQNVISVVLYGNGSAKQVGHRCVHTRATMYMKYVHSYGYHCMLCRCIGASSP